MPSMLLLYNLMRCCTSIVKQLLDIFPERLYNRLCVTFSDYFTGRTREIKVCISNESLFNNQNVVINSKVIFAGLLFNEPDLTNCPSRNIYRSPFLAYQFSWLHLVLHWVCQMMSLVIEMSICTSLYWKNTMPGMIYLSRSKKYNQPVSISHILSQVT